MKDLSISWTEGLLVTMDNTKG